MFFNLPIKKISWLTFGSLLSILLGYVSFKSLPDIVVKQIQKVSCQQAAGFEQIAESPRERASTAHFQVDRRLIRASPPFSSV